ncbi:MAG: porphobilinogen synthase [Proteobacteria bacterium]|nr:porphobilinogen synthase [Pseudomonadota bacterium]
MRAAFPSLRLRRLRQNPAIRALIRETELNLRDLVLPLFIKREIGEKHPVASMPGHFQIPLSLLDQEIKEIKDLGISTIMLFGVPNSKDEFGLDSYSDQGIMQKAIRKVRAIDSDLLIMSDICFCQYTDHGHCGILSDHTGKIDLHNDKTLELLVRQAVSHAQAGSNVLCPSGMADGAVGAIRQALDLAGFEHVAILSHAVKYASSLYGPFRFATEGAPSFGDRKTYQMDPANAAEALGEAHSDVREGADMLMVKPAHAYLDVIYRIKQAYPYIPLGAYHTSGEFGMLKAASEKGWCDERKAVMEILTSIRRAGADFIVSYYTKEVAEWGILPR